MSPLASRRASFVLLRVLGGALTIGIGSLVASSCLTPAFDFGGGSVVGPGGEGNTPAHCQNGVQDEDESDRDCGGSCRGCDVGETCKDNFDCAPPPEGSADIPVCKSDRCAFDCRLDFADCNSRGSDGCEAHLQTDLEHCGGCGMECNPEHATAQCMNGDCLIKTDEPNQGCDPNYANCDLREDNGCEVNLRTDPNHCGSCEDAICSAENGTAVCGGSKCSIECDDGYGDCDGDARINGCEIRTDVNVNHCGKCGNVCGTNGPEWSAYCVDGVCGQTDCSSSGSGKGDCDGDGECTDDLNTVENCGRCGASCFVTHGTPVCDVGDDAGTCVVEDCDSGWADCDDSYATGCEVDTQTSTQRCGGCLESEGGSGEDCSAKVGEDHVTVTSCGSGKCQVVSCETGYADCDGKFDNGCETNTSSDEDNCGGCAAAGGDVCKARAHTSSDCVSSACEYECDDDWLDTDNDRYAESGSDGCETPELAEVGAGVWGSLDTGMASQPLTLEHDLQGSRGAGRLILVGVVCRANNANDCQLPVATYGSTQLTVLQRVFNNQAGAAIYYVLDDDLPSSGSHTVTLDRPGWGSLSAEVIEFQGVAQDPFYSVQNGANDGNNCNNKSNGDIQLTLPGVASGSIIYAVGGGATGSASGGTAKAFPPFILSQNEGAEYIVFGSSLTGRLDPTQDRTPVFEFTDCNSSSMAAVALRAAN